MLRHRGSTDHLPAECDAMVGCAKLGREVCVFWCISGVLDGRSGHGVFGAGDGVCYNLGVLGVVLGDWRS